MGCFAHNYSRNASCYFCTLDKEGNAVELNPVQKKSDVEDEAIETPEKVQTTISEPKEAEQSMQKAKEAKLSGCSPTEFVTNALALASAEAEAHHKVVTSLEHEMIDLRAEQSRISARLQVVNNNLSSARGRQDVLNRRSSFFQSKVDNYDAGLSPGCAGSFATEFSRGDSAERCDDYRDMRRRSRLSLLDAERDKVQIREKLAHRPRNSRSVSPSSPRRLVATLSPVRSSRRPRSRSPRRRHHESRRR